MFKIKFLKTITQRDAQLFSLAVAVYCLLVGRFIIEFMVICDHASLELL